jgi:hypothetical protein
MSPKPVTAFRQLLEDMAVRHFGEESKHDYSTRNTTSRWSEKAADMIKDMKRRVTSSNW